METVLSNCSGYENPAPLEGVLEGPGAVFPSQQCITDMHVGYSFSLGRSNAL